MGNPRTFRVGNPLHYFMSFISRTISTLAALLVLPCVPASAANGNWYFSWGYSRQEYADSSIHISQPSLGNDFTVHDAKATDYPEGIGGTLHSIFSFDFTSPQENVRVGRYLNPDQTFAIEFSLDHSKYNTTNYQTAKVTGTIDGQAYDGEMKLDPQTFSYALHNGLNHVMLNAVWFHHLRDAFQQRPGDLQLVSRVGAGILLPHAENTIFGDTVELGPKNKHVCCSSGDWWQLNGWTVGTEVGLRYTVYKSAYLELTQKFAYGKLNNVQVYAGSADQTLWMSEQVLSAGFQF